MDVRKDDMLRLTPTAAATLAAHFAGDNVPVLRVFLSFWDEAGPRLDLGASEPTPEDETFDQNGFTLVISRQLLMQAAPLVIDCDDQGFVIHSSLDFSEAGGSCGGDCSH